MKTDKRPESTWKQWTYLSLGIALVPIGVIIAPLPGPMGVPTIALGMLLIVSSSRRAASWVRLHRKKWTWMHELLEKGEEWIGGHFGEALRRTNRRPGRVDRPPLPLGRRLLDIMLFPLHAAAIALRSLSRRFGWRIPFITRD